MNEDCLAASLVEWSQVRLPKVLMRCFWFFENFSVVARSLELCPVYGNRLTPYYMGFITQMVISGKTLLLLLDCLDGRVVASANVRQGVSGSIPGSGKVLLCSFRLFENFSVLVRSLELCPVYGNRLTLYFMGLKTQMVISVYIVQWHYVAGLDFDWFQAMLEAHIHEQHSATHDAVTVALLQT
ncbi:hypothetical protein SFRURICE_010715 [Spodoptera frugiperda]|nr:hypothetical protein SFRURICE_010715 [Spodoptera frugiperda]